MSVSYDFSGKVALVTGSSDGIGAAIALLFAKSGAEVVVTGRNGDKVSSVAEQCSRASPKGLKPLQVVADVSSEEQCKRLVQQTIDRFGKLDIVVNNAGIGMGAGITDTEYVEKYEKVLATNLNACIYLTHESVPHLEKTKGNIINISSIGAKVSVRNLQFLSNKYK